MLSVVMSLAFTPEGLAKVFACCASVREVVLAAEDTPPLLLARTSSVYCVSADKPLKV